MALTLKVCTQCDFEDEEALFGDCRNVCKECIKAQHRARNKKKRETLLEYQRNRRTERRAYMDELKSKPCMDCGGEFPPICMDFDHRPGTDKQFNLADAYNHSIDEIHLEIDKCDLVCSNCHRIRTAERRN